VGARTEDVLLFLRSLLSVSKCDVVLFVDTPVPASTLKDARIASDRLMFESVNGASFVEIGNARYKMFKEYLVTANILKAYSMVLITDVDDVVFQHDPFLWASTQTSGAHMFVSEPGHTVLQDKTTVALLKECFGAKATPELYSADLVESGFAIGTVLEMDGYLQATIQGLSLSPGCLKPGADQAAINVIAHYPPAGVKVQLHEGHSGPVWVGRTSRTKPVVNFDGNKNIINQEGIPYMVIHKYREHEGLSKVLKEKNMHTGDKSLGCSAFEVLPGDMAGHDLSHGQASIVSDCCTMCLNLDRCGAFVFSRAAQHCWLKMVGGSRQKPKTQSDSECGILNGMTVVT